MPLIDDPIGQGFIDNPMLPDEQRRQARVQSATPGFMEVVSAEFQTNNVIASVRADESSYTSKFALQAYDPDFDLGAELKGTPWENDPGLFVTARNRDHVQAIMRDIERDQRNADVIERSTWGQYIPALIAGQVADPINWLSLGTVGAIRYAGKAALMSTTARAGVIGAGVAADTAAQEAILQASQQTRTAAESAVAITGSFALGSLLGWAASKLLLPAERARLEADIERDLLPDAPRPVGLSRPSDVGAAASRVEQETPAPELVGSFGAGWLSSRVGPLQRTSRSTLESTRRVVQELASSPYVYKGNVEGQIVAPRGDALGRPGAVKDRIESVWASELAPAMSAMRDEFLAYRGVHAKEWGKRALMGLNDRFGRDGEALSEVEFRQAVTDAVHNGGQHDIPQVANAAKRMMTYLSRVEEEGKAAGLVEEGESVIPRAYLHDAINGDRLRFREIIFNHLRARQSEQLAEVQRLDAERTAAAEQAENVSNEVRAEREIARLRDQAQRDFETGSPGRYTGPPLKDEEIDTIVGFWSYVREIEARAKPESLTSYIVRTGGLEDPNGDVLSLLGRSRDRPGLIRKSGDTSPGMFGPGESSGRTLDDWALRAWENGYFPNHTERPTINEFLDALGDDLGGNPRVRGDDEGFFEDLAVARDMERELEEYGITPRQFRSEARLREFFGQKPARAADEDAGAAGSTAGRDGAATDPELTKAEQRLRIRANMVDGELYELADRIIERIGRIGEGRISHVRDLLRDADDAVNEGALLESADFAIPYNQVRDFVQRDAEILLRMIHRSQVPDIEIALRFGDPDMTAAREQITQEATARMNAAETPKERAKIKKQLDRDLRDIDGMRDRISGRYGLPQDPTSVAVRAGRFARDAATVTKMGMSPLASVPETARLITARGLSAVFSDLFFPMMTDWAKFTSTADEARMITHALEHWTSSRALAFADSAEDWGSTPKVDRFSRETTKAFMRLTGLPKLTDWQKSASGVLVMRNILEAAEAMKAGKATPKQVRDLSRLGISKENATIIAEQFAKHGIKDERIWAAETGKWDTAARAGREAFMTAMRREVDRLITTPGEEVPLLASNEVGRLFFQFKTFAIGAYERVLVSGLQHNDAKFWASAVTAIAIAMMVNEARKAAFGTPDGKRQKSFAERWRDPNERNQIWIEAVDRSGVLGWMPEINQTMDRVFGAGLSSGFGTIQRRPGVGTAGDAFKQFAGAGLNTGADLTLAGTKAAMAMAGKHRWREADTRQMERVIPFIGLSYIRAGLEALGAEEAVNQAVNARRSAAR